MEQYSPNDRLITPYVLRLMNEKLCSIFRSSKSRVSYNAGLFDFCSLVLRQHLAGFPQTHDRNGDTPGVCPSSCIRQCVMLDPHIQSHVQCSCSEKRKTHRVHDFCRQLGNIPGNLSKQLTIEASGFDDRLTTAAAKSGKTSIAFKCAPRTLAKWFHTSAGNLVFHASRFVRGIALLISPLVACMRRTR